jgi:hypothetical protein
MDEFQFERLRRVVAHIVASTSGYEAVSNQALYMLANALQRCTSHCERKRTNS